MDHRWGWIVIVLLQQLLDGNTEFAQRLQQGQRRTKESDCSVCCMFGYNPHGEVTGKYLLESTTVIDGWNVNGNQCIIYSDRIADLDHFEWSHVHAQQHT